MLKTFAYRLYPSKPQARLLERTLETCRRWYNQCLAERRDAYQQRGETVSKFAQLAFQSTPSGGKATPHRRYAPDAAQNAPGASQKPVPRQKPGRSAHRARRRPERARSQPQAPTARYFASARSPIRSGFDCDARALRNCNSTRPSCARRRRRSASVIGCGRPARSHRMHSSFVRVGFSFLLHVHAGRYGCSASGFHSLTSSRSRNRSSSVRE